MLVLNHNNNEASVIVQNASAATTATPNSGRKLVFCVVRGRRCAARVFFLSIISCFSSIIYTGIADRARSRHRLSGRVEISGALCCVWGFLEI